MKSYREALCELRTHHFTVHGVDLLEGIAMAAAALGRFEASALLFAAAATWFDTHGAEIRTGFDPDARDQTINRVRVQLGGATWERVYADARRLSLGQAIQLADEVIRELTAALDARRMGLTDRELDVLRLLTLWPREFRDRRAARHQPSYRTRPPALHLHQARSHHSCGRRSTKQSALSSREARGVH